MSMSVPDLKLLMDRTLLVKLNGKRVVSGQLRGYDQFLNIILKNAFEEVSPTCKQRESLGVVFLRGSSVLNLEPLEKIVN